MDSPSSERRFRHSVEVVPHANTPHLGTGVSRESKKTKAKAGKGERAFDEWLNRGLHDLYDEVVREPVPPDLLKLIEEDRKK